MGPINILGQLQNLVPSDDFAHDSSALTEHWVSSGVGAEAIEPIFRFMEANSRIDFGSPGALVHFAERFYGAGYEAELVASLERKPTEHTAWMMNRVINGTKEADLKYKYIAVLKRARLHPDADWNARKQIDGFLKRLSA